MILTESVYLQLNEFSGIPSEFEIGGILGSADSSDIVSEIELDVKAIGHRDTYQPDVESLNLILQKWSEKRVSFRGLFHSHPKNYESLSNDDKDYIQITLGLLPINYVCYFPILVNGCIKAYSAYKNADLEVVIEQCPIEIIKDI